MLVLLKQDGVEWCLQVRSLRQPDMFWPKSATPESATFIGGREGWGQAPGRRGARGKAEEGIGKLTVAVPLYRILQLCPGT